jgi:hypothetical protein
MSGMDLNVKVAVRCRPMSSKETARGCQSIILISGSKITINGVDAQHESKDFTFDFCYGPDSEQNTVYLDLGQPMLQQALDGFNATVFAYGQTGSGKSFSMMGTDSDPNLKGIIPQLNDDLFVKVKEKLTIMQEKAEKENSNAKTKFMVSASFLEVYNEEIKDLLNPSDRKLKIHEHPKHGIYVEDLCELVVRDSKDLLKLIYQGNAVRRVAATKMNEESSRSHSVFTIKIEQQTVTELAGGVTREQTVKAKLNLVDLAGSERAAKTGASGSTLKEGANINLSLMALGNVINMLSEGKKVKNKVIPYRDSKLTRLLQESLGGNAATTMIAAISPADYNYSETLSTLRYANRAKSIANALTRNEDSNERMIRDLKSQIEELKRQLEQGVTGGGGVDSNSEELERKLRDMEANQLNAFEEKERLSKALEEERQSNMNMVISEMMHSVKEQKVMHMKNIKRLTNEKTQLTKGMKDTKESNLKMKKDMDKYIVEYQQLQKRYDEVAAHAATIEGSNEEETKMLQTQELSKADEIARTMITLLSTIEETRQQYTEQRTALKKLKERLDLIEIELTDERGELVATTGLLSQNDKLREQIQVEEREKMRVQLEQEMLKQKSLMDEERKNVRETISSELEKEMQDLRSEAAKLKSQLTLEQAKCAEYAQQEKLGQEYAEELEQRLADSEVEIEESRGEQAKLLSRIQALVDEREQLSRAEQQLRNELDEVYGDQIHAEADIDRRIEEAKFEVFSQLMDMFERERYSLHTDHMNTKRLLKQAVEDIGYLTARNTELSQSLERAIQYEPTIR